MGNKENKSILSFTEISEANFKFILGTNTEIVSKIKAIDKVFDKLRDNVASAEFLIQPFFLVRSHSFI